MTWPSPCNYQLNGKFVYKPPKFRHPVQGETIVAKPIDNNSLQNLSNSLASRPGGQPDAKQASTGDQLPAVANGRQDDAVTVSRAAEAMNRKHVGQGDDGVIKTPEHAAQVAKTLRGLLEANSGQALAAQAKNVSSELMYLLQAG